VTVQLPELSAMIVIGCAAIACALSLVAIRKAERASDKAAKAMLAARQAMGAAMGLAQFLRVELIECGCPSCMEDDEDAADIEDFQSDGKPH